MELEIAASELTNVQAPQVFSRVLGKPVRFRKRPLPLVRAVLRKEFYLMFRWFDEAEFQADIAGLRHVLSRFAPSRPPRISHLRAADSSRCGRHLRARRHSLAHRPPPLFVYGLVSQGPQWPAASLPWSEIRRRHCDRPRSRPANRRGSPGRDSGRGWRTGRASWTAGS